MLDASLAAPVAGATTGAVRPALGGSIAPVERERTIAARTRVAFVGQAGGAAGGAERTLVTYLRHLPADIAPTLVLFEDGVFADEVRRLGIAVEIVAAPASLAASTRERPRLDALVYGASFVGRLAQRLRDLQVDVVYSNTVKAHFACAAAARLARLPLIMHFHDLLDGTRLAALRLTARFGSVERIACAGVVADAIGLPETTVSYGPVVRETFEALPSRRDARAQLGLPPDVPLVSIVGRINRWKGHDRFIRIAGAVRRAHPATQFAIVGAAIFRDADFVPELHALVRQLGLQDAISFIPWVDDVRTVYAATDVNVNCSTREPFGRSVPEAACAGVPSVCFDDSGAAETIIDRCTGRIVPAGDEAAFAAAIGDMLTTASDGEQHALVRYSARQFDADALTRDVAAVIRRVAARTSRVG